MLTELSWVTEWTKGMSQTPPTSRPLFEHRKATATRKEGPGNRAAIAAMSGSPSASDSRPCSKEDWIEPTKRVSSDEAFNPLCSRIARKTGSLKHVANSIAIAGGGDQIIGEIGGFMMRHSITKAFARLRPRKDTHLGDCLAVTDGSKTAE